MILSVEAAEDRLSETRAARRAQDRRNLGSKEGTRAERALNARMLITRSLRPASVVHNAIQLDSDH